MADRFPGGVISKTPPTVVAPVDGEGGSASGVWTLAEQLGLQKAGVWPGRVLPRELYAWGTNSSGQLGDNTTVNKSSPVQIGSPLTWLQPPDGLGSHSLAVSSEKKLYAWGYNSSGQVGDSTVISRSSPIQIGALTVWSQVFTGSQHSAALREDGSLWTWGANDFFGTPRGQLGLGDTLPRSSPTQVGALLDWVSVRAGNRHTVAITTDGELYAWGANQHGQVGDNTIVDKSSPVQIGALTNWASVAPGGLHTLAVKTDGTMWAWGRNNSGQLGLNDTTDRSSPVQVGVLTAWSAAAGGAYHSLARTTSLALFAWGSNYYGAVGDNTTINKSSPTQVGSLTDWTQVTGLRNHSGAVRQNGTLWVWGRNNFGQIGDNTTVTKSSPTQVGSSTNWVSVGGAAQFTTALLKGT